MRTEKMMDKILKICKIILIVLFSFIGISIIITILFFVQASIPRTVKDLPVGIWEDKEHGITLDFTPIPTDEIEDSNVRQQIGVEEVYAGYYFRDNEKIEILFCIGNVSYNAPHEIYQVLEKSKEDERYYPIEPSFISAIDFEKDGFYLKLNVNWKEKMGCKRFVFEQVS